MANKTLETLVKDWNDWNGYQSIAHNPQLGADEPDLRVNVGQKYHKMDPNLYPDPYFLIKKRAKNHVVKKYINEGLNESENRLYYYARNSYKLLLNTIAKSAKDRLYGIALAIEPYRTGDNKWEWDTATAIQELRGLTSLLGDGTKENPPQISEMQKVVLGSIKSEYMKKAAIYYMASSPANVETLFTNYLNSKNKALEGRFSDGNALSEDKLMRYVLRRVERTIAIGSEKQRSDLYKILAVSAYTAEHK